MVQVTIEDIVGAMDRAIETVDEAIAQLNDLKNDMKHYEQKKNKSKTAGTTANVVGAGLTAAGAFFTGGIVLAIGLVVGIGFTVVGAVTNAITEYVDYKVTQKCTEKIKSLIQNLFREADKITCLSGEFQLQIESMMTRFSIDCSTALIFILGGRTVLDLFENPAALTGCASLVTEYLSFSASELELVANLFGFSINLGKSVEPTSFVFLAEKAGLITTGEADFITDAGTEINAVSETGISTAGKAGLITVGKVGVRTVGKTVSSSVSKTVTKSSAVLGVVVVSYEVANLLQEVINDHITIAKIKRICCRLREEQSKIQKMSEKLSSITDTALLKLLKRMCRATYPDTSDDDDNDEYVVTVKFTVQRDDLKNGSKTTPAVREFIALIGAPGDHAGHLRAKIFNGSGSDCMNFVPMSSDFTIHEFERHEMLVRSEIRANDGAFAEVTIYLHYKLKNIYPFRPFKLKHLFEVFYENDREPLVLNAIFSQVQ